MAKKIALFNHKGGVSKTTTTFNLGWILASKGKKVVLVDTDPQCNLTGLIMGYKGPTELETFYQSESEKNIRAGLAPAFESMPRPIEAVECVETNNKNLFLLPGHIRLSEYEVTLGIAQELSGSIQTLQNLPGSISFLLDRTAEKYNADYVLIDMSPGLSSINQNILMTSDFFIVPTSPDYFSVMALDSLANILPKWKSWAKKAASIGFLKDASYPFPQPSVKLLGTIVQKYRPRSNAPARAFQTWIDKINEMVEKKLFPVLKDNEMVLEKEAYEKVRIQSNYCLAAIPDFNTLIAKSQEKQTPIYDLTKEQIGQTGPVLENTLKSRDEFKEIFSSLADKVISLTSK